MYIAVNIFKNVCMCVCACVYDRERERQRVRDLTTAIGLFGVATFSFAVSNLQICGAIWWLNLLCERRPGNAVGSVSRLVGSVLDQSTAHSFTRCQYYFERKSSEELWLCLPAQETSSVPI